MNIENVKQIFGSPAMGQQNALSKETRISLLIGVAAIVGIAMYLIHKEKQRSKINERSVK